MRYEDSVSNPGKPFAAGITLRELFMFTTDHKWDEKNVESLAKIIYKVGYSQKSYSGHN